MCALSNRIREKPNWWEKVKDQIIVERWRGEALQQAGVDSDEQPSEWNLTPGMVNPSLLCLRPCYTHCNPFRSTTYSRSSMDTQLCATRRLG